MKPKEDIAMKCAIGGGLVGLLMGLLVAIHDLNVDGGGIISLFQALLTLVLWGFSLALISGVFAFFVLWLAERRFGPPAGSEKAPDVILQKTSYLRGLQSETHKAYLDISNHVVTADQHLTAAEKEFEAGAFAPFWDEIERAANELAAYKNEVEHLRRSVDVYKNEATDLERLSVPAPPLDLSGRQLPDARPAAARFMATVRKAQTNFQFAVIYEQRKTNQLLHAGFGNLGAAIYALGDSINASLDNLSKTLQTQNKSIFTLDKTMLDKLLTSKADKADKADKEESAQLLKEHEKDHSSALDRIQRKDRLG